MQKPRTISELQGLTTKAPRVRDKRIEQLRNSHLWRSAAKSHLARNPICVFCEQYNRLTPAQCVDHIIPWRGDVKLFWEHGNWQSLCNTCHGRKGMAELDIQYRRIEGRYVVTGLRGVGKSTWVAERAKPGDIVWDLDAEAQRLGYGAYPRTHTQLVVLYAYRGRLIKGLERSGDPCYIIIHGRLRAGLDAHRLGAKVVVVTCSEDERQRRLIARDGNVGNVEMVGGSAYVD